MSTAWRVMSYFRKYWLAVAVAFVCLTLVTAAEVYIPQLIRQVIDCGIRVGAPAEGNAVSCPVVPDPMQLVWSASLLIVGLTALKGLFHFGHGYLGEFSAHSIAYDIRNEIYRHLQRLSFGWHDRAQTGQLMARATSDVEQLRHFTGRAVLQLAQLILLGTGISIVLFSMNWKLAIAALLTLPFLVRTIAQYHVRVRPLFRLVQEELAVLAAITQENIAGAKVIKAFAREKDEIRKFESQNARLQEQYVAAAEVQSFTNPLMDSIANLGTVIVVWFGGYLIITGDLSVGELVAFNAYLLLIVRPVRRLGFLVGQSSRALAAAERIFEILDAPIDVIDRPGAQPMPPIRGEVMFDHVWVSYFGGEPVLRDVSFRVHPGRVVALLGATGSGKSTIVNLISRFYDVGQGQVLVDGHDVRDVQLESLRRQIGFVLQDTTLFTGTIRDNIAFGVPDATDEAVVAVAKAARAHDFICEFPLGYETRVGERGITLSGGQKQRVAIARALLLNPKILILDDFTSAVDTETEVLIREALDVLMRDRTTFVIAQRVSTVQNADVILVLDHGEIVGMGTHEELLESNPIYAEIFRLQLMDETVVEVFGAERAAALVGVSSLRENRQDGGAPMGGGWLPGNGWADAGDGLSGAPSRRGARNPNRNGESR
ncbi:MAG: ATP-binding cassette domain-containing protein [Chloroflexi bacterium]|nr:ATP-binding cassette domain-containing protein [Chloroflexota bacterium]